MMPAMDRMGASQARIRNVAMASFVLAIFFAPHITLAANLGSAIDHVESAGRTIHEGDATYRSEFGSTDGYWRFYFTWPTQVANQYGFLMIARGTFGHLEGGAPQSEVNYTATNQSWGPGANTEVKSLGQLAVFAGPVPTDGTYTVILADAASAASAMEWFASGGTSGAEPTNYAFLTFTYARYHHCCSSVAFIPGMEGSVLKEGTNTLWPPTILSNDLSRLALNADGTSVNTITVDGILNTFYGAPIYSGFSTFMDDLVASSTMQVHEWLPLPYDWRYAPDEASTTAAMADAIEQLAHESNDGKVTIVAHSMGGLVGKAVIKTLEERGEGGLVENFVMVGSPQLGTPQAVASILHGDGQGIAAGLIVRRADARAIAQNMPSAYALLPSREYFNRVTDPVIAFSPASPFTAAWRAFWGDSINTYADYASFMTGADVPRVKPILGTLGTPEVVSPTLLADADAVHTVYDTYTFPASTRVVQIAGWGIPTVKGVLYQNEHLFPNYRPLFTAEGDKTVVYPSAISSIGESYFVNLSLYNKNESENAQHRSLLSTVPIQNLISKILLQTPISGDYISNTKPPITEAETELVVSTHSPVVLGAYDSLGNYTGVNPGQDPNAAVWLTSEGIPGSTFLTSGDSQYLFLPQGGTYNFVFTGTDTGSTTVAVEQSVADVTNPVAQYSDIPVVVGTVGTFTISQSAPIPDISVDINGDSQPDAVVTADGHELTLQQLLDALRTQIGALTIKDKVKANLLKKVDTIQKKVEKQKVKKASKVATNLEKLVLKRAAKGKISDADAEAISALLDSIISQL